MTVVPFRHPHSRLAVGSLLARVLWRGRGRPSLSADRPPPSPPDRADWSRSPECCSFFAGSRQEVVEGSYSGPRSREIWLASFAQTVQVLVDGEKAGWDAWRPLAPNGSQEWAFFSFL